MHKIKILATVGPNSLNKYTIQKMDESGIDMFRLNLSHTSVKDYKIHMNNLLSWTKKPISTDTEGAQIRTGKFSNGGASIKSNQIIDLTFRNVIGNYECIPLYPNVKEPILKQGDILNIDFNSVAVQIIEVKGTEMKGRVLSGGIIGNNKGIGVDRIIELPYLTEKDFEILKISESLGLKHFALSFASSGENVKLFRELFPYQIYIISKIESRMGIRNLSAICNESDEILIDRGDLSREISLNKIALAQKYILAKAKEYNTPVNVATNLLDSMMTAEQPSRAEINDITSSLYDGASGLVLAAETAIGGNPIKSVRFVSSIIKEVISFKENLTEKLMNDSYDHSLIECHGGTLIQSYSLPAEQDNFLPQIEVDQNTIMDCIQICHGTFSPLKGFMGLTELNTVLIDYKLTSGITWTMPILLQIHETDVNKIKGHEKILLIHNGEICARIDVTSISYLENKEEIVQKWFLTTDQNHPGVARFISKGNYIIEGEVALIKIPGWAENSFSLTPRQTRSFFEKNLWKKVVGFHTRNIIHKGHEFIQKQAIEDIGADALFISPVVGEKKKGDFSSQAILTSYQTMLANNFYDPIPVLLGTFNTYSRYCGPREAIFTAICRKNFGCSHFIIGRDHTGVKDYYKNINIEEFAKKIGSIGIALIFFNPVIFCKKTNRLRFQNDIETEDSFKEISGTSIRDFILNNDVVPDYLARKEIIDSILKMANEHSETIFVS
jgi:ATP sulfurylase